MESGAGGDGWQRWLGGEVERVEVLGGAPPRRPGRGGGRWWRRRGEGERSDMPGPKGIGAAARDFDPSSSLPLF